MPHRGLLGSRLEGARHDAPRARSRRNGVRVTPAHLNPKVHLRRLTRPHTEREPRHALPRLGHFHRHQGQPLERGLENFGEGEPFPVRPLPRRGRAHAQPRGARRPADVQPPAGVQSTHAQADGLAIQLDHALHLGRHPRARELIHGGGKGGEVYRLPRLPPRRPALGHRLAARLPGARRRGWGGGAAPSASRRREELGGGPRDRRGINPARASMGEGDAEWM
mmetsp:Transcript_18764/g.60272  ORF Transcript_18764/g.60272 Transcript_18764/m.60272 type:complete len:223 (-) Transcript_18764:107-775(-)